jgi:hypothetical protein
MAAMAAHDKTKRLFNTFIDRPSSTCEALERERERERERHL